MRMSSCKSEEDQKEGSARPRPMASVTSFTSHDKNPYLHASRTWKYVLDVTAGGQKVWMITALFAMAIALTLSGVVTYLATRTQYQPYIVEVDEHGQTIGKGPIKAVSINDSRLLRGAVAEFVSDSRTVTPDVALQRKFVFRTYAKLSPEDPATVKMNEWMNKDHKANPFERAKKEMVSIEDVTLLAQSPDTWQAEWTEVTRDRQGLPVKSTSGIPARAHMRALVTIYLAQSRKMTEEEMEMNPLAIFVRDYSWSQIP